MRALQRALPRPLGAVGSCAARWRGRSCKLCGRAGAGWWPSRRLMGGTLAVGRGKGGRHAAAAKAWRHGADRRLPRRSTPCCTWRAAARCCKRHLSSRRPCVRSQGEFSRGRCRRLRLPSVEALPLAALGRRCSGARRPWRWPHVAARGSAGLGRCGGRPCRRPRGCRGRRP